MVTENIKATIKDIKEKHSFEPIFIGKQAPFIFCIDMSEGQTHKPFYGKKLTRTKEKLEETLFDLTEEAIYITKLHKTQNNILNKEILNKEIDIIKPVVIFCIENSCQEIEESVKAINNIEYRIFLTNENLLNQTFNKMFDYILDTLPF